MPWVAAGAALLGAGVSAFGLYQQGKQAEIMGNYNAHQQEINTRNQLMQMQAQAAIQQRQAEAEFAVRSLESKAAFADAQSIENQIPAISAAARESARRKADEYARFSASQRASISASGLAEAGTPLDILAETAGKIQLEREDDLYKDELNRRQLFREAEQTRLGGEYALAGASLDRSLGRSASILTAAAGQAEFRSGLRRAEITRLTGQADRYASNFAMAGSILSGVADTAGAVTKTKWYQDKYGN